MTSEKGSPPRRGAPIFAATILFTGVLLVAVLYALSHPVHDYVEYWTAAHLLAAHRNPYSLGDMFQGEKSLGMNGPVPLMLLSPPWVMGLIVPLGFVKSYILGWFLWTAILMAAVAVSSCLLMNVYFGDLRIPEVSDKLFYRCLFAFTFYPALLSLRFSQTAPIMLLGLAGFLFFETRHRPIWAGASLSLTLIKPQLSYLVWTALLLWTLRERRWKMLISAIVTLAVLTAVALPFDPRLMQHYRELATSPYMELFPSGVMWWPRMLLGGLGTFWIQFVPSVAGVAWMLLYWRKYNHLWSWSERLPLILTVSVLTSAYGWLWDQTLLVAAVIYVAAKAANPLGRFPANLVLIYTAMNCLLMALWPFPTIGLLPAPVFLLVLLIRYDRRMQSVEIPASVG